MESTILDYFKEIVRYVEKPVIFEIGTCDGLDTGHMLEILDCKADYYCFEPVPELCDQVRSKFGNKVNMYNVAIGNKDENGKLFISSGDLYDDNGVLITKYYGSSSIKTPKLIKRDFKDMQFKESEVQIVKLDTFCKKNKIDHIDFIWADVQGAEKDMIKGGLEALKKTRFLYTEYHADIKMPENEMYVDDTGLDQIIELLPNFEIIKDFGGDVLLRNKDL